MPLLPSLLSPQKDTKEKEKYDLHSTTEHLEEVMYRRNADRSSGDFAYHNHILQGRYLRYMVTPIKNKRDAASFRLVMVAGRAKGRMRELKLHKASEISLIVLNPEASPNGHRWIVNVSGVCVGRLGWGVQSAEETWQIATANEVQQQEWADALRHSRDLNEIEESNGDMDKLRALANAMREAIPVRSHIGKFRIYRNCFLGARAVRWLRRELGCSQNTAVAMGNRMLNSGIFHHVNYEHIFTEKTHLYRFDADSAENDEEEPWQDAFYSTRQHLRSARLAIALLQSTTDSLNMQLKHKTIKLDEVSSRINSTQNYALIFATYVITLWLRPVDGVKYATIICILSISARYMYNLYLPSNSSSSEPNLEEMHATSHIYGGEFEDDEVELDDDDIFAADELTPDVERDKDRDRSSISPPSSPRAGGETGVVGAELPSTHKWPSYPILVRRSVSMVGVDATEAERTILQRPMNIHSNSDFPIESELFKGKIHMTVNDIPDTPEYARREKGEFLFRYIIQGRFKAPLPCSGVYSGYMYEGPIHPPSKPAWLTESLIRLATNVQPRIKVHASGNSPYALSPLMSTARVICINTPGVEPSITNEAGNLIEEDLSLMDKTLAGMSSRKRKTFFSSLKNLEQSNFSPDFVYTFVFVQQQINLANNTVDLGFAKFNLQNILCNKPLQIMTVAWNPNTPRPLGKPPVLWECEVHHEKAHKIFHTADTRTTTTDDDAADLNQTPQKQHRK